MSMLDVQDQNGDLEQAIELGDVEWATYLLKHGANPNHQCRRRFGTAHTQLNELLQTGDNVPEVHQYPVLLAAAVSQVPEMVKALLDAGADVNGVVQSANGTTYHALLVASEMGAKDVVALLAARGADQKLQRTARHSTNTAITRAASNRSDIVEILLDYPQAKTALQVVLDRASASSYRGYPSNENTSLRIAAKAVDAGADVNAELDTLTPLMRAAASNAPEMVKFLINRGAELEKVRQCPAMHQACGNKAPECIRVLTKHGVRLHERDLGRAVWSKDDETILAALENCKQNGIAHRNMLAPRAASFSSVVETIVKDDHEKSTRFLFEQLGEDLFQKTTAGGPLLRICGPKAKAVILSLRTMGQVAQIIGDADGASESRVQAPAKRGGMAL